MYCKKCGRFIGEDIDLCDVCAEETTVVISKQTANVDTSSINLGKAIAAAILSNVGFIFAYAGVISMVFMKAEVIIFIGSCMTILGFIFGLMSIFNFKNTSNIKSGKRIPVLILGIESVVMSGIWFIILMMMLLAIMFAN